MKKTMLSAMLALFCCVFLGIDAHAAECRLAYAAKAQYAPQILAFGNNWFQAEGIKFVPVDLGMGTGIAAAEALISGSADAAVMGDVPAIMAVASGFPCRLVCAYGGGENMHSLIVSDKSGITTVADLAGKIIGVHFGSSAHGGMELFLEKHGLAKSVKLVNTPQSNLAEALASGSVDAILASEPAPSIALDKVKGARKLTTLAGLGNDYPLMLVVAEKFANEHPAAVAALVEGTRKGVDFILEDRAKAAAELSRATGTPVKIEERSLGNLAWKVVMDRQVVNSLEQTARFLKSLGRLKTMPDIAESIYKGGK